jgi:hypothetical protein
VSAAELDRSGSVPRQSGPAPADPPQADPAAEPPPVDPPAGPPPADPGWRLRHLPMLVAISGALVLCAASAGLLAGGRDAALGAAAGVLLVTISFTMSTLVVAWADAVRPALLMPLGLLTYVIKYTLIAVIMLAIAESGWPGGMPMAWGLAAGAVLLTAAQVWWVSKLARADAAGRAAAGPPDAP